MTWDKFEKLVSLVQQKITTIILYRLKDPRIGFLTVTKVELSRDLKTCLVYYSVFGSEGDRSKTAQALKDARGHIQGEVGKTLRTRTVPRVQFRFDDTVEQAERIAKILNKIKSEKSENDLTSEEQKDDEHPTV